MDVDLQFARFVDRGVEESQETLSSCQPAHLVSAHPRPDLMRDIRPSIADVAVHLAHDADVLIAVEQGVFLVTDAIATTAMGSFVGLEAGVRQDHDHALGIFIGRSDRDMLFGDQLWKGEWWARLCSYRRPSRREVRHDSND